MAPSYLSDLLAYRTISYSLRSISKGDLIEPSSRTREHMVIDPSQHVPQDCGTRCRLKYAEVLLLTFLKSFKSLNA